MMNLELDHFLNEVPSGWHHLVKSAHNRILEVDPEYRIRQIKEKFGTLRYYYEPSRSTATIEIDRIIKVAEIVSSVVCQDCGSLDGKMTKDNHLLG